jgi:HlyD family secretion protein
VKDLFRKPALEHLASPDQLHAALQVTDRKGWLALLACFVVLAIALVWSVYGRLPTRVQGHGILVSKAGLNTVNAPTSGQVAMVNATVGAHLARGDVVARLLQRDLDAELRGAQATVAMLEDEHRRLTSFGTEEARLRSQAAAQQRATAVTMQAMARERQGLLAERLASQQRLIADGLITEAVLQATRDNLNLATGEIKRAQTTLAEIELAVEQNEQRRRRELDERVRRIAEAQRKVDELDAKVNTTSLVVSQVAGQVLEVRTAPGQFVTAGTQLVMIELDDEHHAGMESLVYLPGTEGKRLRPGMVAEISPSTVKREEHGAMRGVVTAVTSFPTTQQAMLAALGNPDLVAGLFKSIDSPIQVKVDLLVDPSTASGYQWTSRQGPATTIQPGTLCTAAITVREQAPITLALPLLHKWLGL